MAAAAASECAAQQGGFEKFSDALFSKQDSIGNFPWERYASAAGIPDLRAFRTCISIPDTVPAIRADIAAGVSLDVAGTPTYLINDVRFQGVEPFDTLQVYVERALRQN